MSIINFDGDNEAIHEIKESTGVNKSGNRPFQQVLASHLSRRNVMKGSLAAAVGAFFISQEVSAGENSTNYSTSGGLIDFEPVTIQGYLDNSNGGRQPVISSDYEYQVLIPWGTPIKSGVAEYDGDPNSRPTPLEQEDQIGIGHDGMWFFAEVMDDDDRWEDDDWDDDDDDDGNRGRSKRRRSKRRQSGSYQSNTDGMLCINHEFGTNSHVLGKPAPENLMDVRLSQAAHGCSVVRVASDFTGYWDVVKDDPRNRRITVNTPVEFDGPVAGTPFLENAACNEPLGTVNNCGSGYTPWGTYLTCEENFNGYFGWNDPSYTPDAKQVRYGFDDDGFGYAWHVFDPRFDLSDPNYANEYNRFGWIVEIDPQNPDKKPVKHTALGCFKHEAIAIRVPKSGKVHCYMGDDQRFDYCYKFVSKKPWQKSIKKGESPLAEGTLYVARFNDDGTGDWLELSINNPALAAAFGSQAELLVNTRTAADILGATPMDRPEWTTVGADGDTVFWTLTNNTNRAPGEENAANPQAPNPDGHIIRTRDRGEGQGVKFDWEIFLLASQTRGTEEVFTDPDAAYADPDGRLFIGTDGGQPDGLNDQLTVIDTTTPLAPGELPEINRLFVGVNSDEITGWAQTPNRKTGMTNMQHPGNGSPAATNFPATDGSGKIPRDCTIVITRTDGGIVGS